LDFKIEMLPESTGGLPEIHKRLLAASIIAKNLASGRMAEPGIELVGSGTLKSVSRAKKMIVDCR